MIDMRNCFGKGKTEFRFTDPALEQDVKTFHRGSRRIAQCRLHPLQSVVMIFAELAKAFRQAGEWQLVPRQNQMPVLRQSGQMGATFQKIPDGIGVRLIRMNSEIGRDRGQQLIAPDNQIIIQRPEGRMSGRMPVPHDDLPAATAKPDFLPVKQPAVTGRQGMNHIREIERPFGSALFPDICWHPGMTPERDCLWSRTFLQVKLQHPGGQPSRPAHHQRSAVFLHEPAGKTDVIRMVMRADNPQDRATAKRAIQQ